MCSTEKSRERNAGRAHNARPYAQCRAARSVQGRTLNAGPHAQCRAARSLQGCTLNAGACMLNAGMCASMQGRALECAHDRPVRSTQDRALQSRALKGRAVRSNAGLCVQCRAVRSMPSRVPNVGPHAQCLNARMQGLAPTDKPPTTPRGGQMNLKTLQRSQNLTELGAHDAESARKKNLGPSPAKLLTARRHQIQNTVELPRWKAGTPARQQRRVGEPHRGRLETARHARDHSSAEHARDHSKVLRSPTSRMRRTPCSLGP